MTMEESSRNTFMRNERRIYRKQDRRKQKVLLKAY